MALIINLSEVITQHVSQFSQRAGRIFALAAEHSFYTASLDARTEQDVIDAANEHAHALDIPIPDNVIESCLDWAARVNTLSPMRLRLLAIANIVSGTLYNHDCLSEDVAIEIGQLSANIDNIDLQPIRLAEEYINVSEWDNPLISVHELALLSEYIPIAVADYHNRVVMPTCYEHKAHVRH